MSQERDTHMKKHRIPNHKKLEKDGQWIKDMAEYWIPTFSRNDHLYEKYKMQLANYRLYNNELDQEELNAACNRLGINVGQINDDIKPYNKTPNKVNVILGEELKRNENFKPILVSGHDLHEKTQELRQAVARKYENVVARIQDIMQDGNLSPEQIQDRLTKLQAELADDAEFTNYRSQREKTVSNILNYGRYDQNIKAKKNEGLKHGLISGEEIIWVGHVRGKPVIETVNSINAFSIKAPDEPFMQNGEAAGRRYALSGFEILETFGDNMSKEEIERFEIQDYESIGKHGTEKIDFTKRNRYIWDNVRRNALNIEDRVGSHWSDENKLGDLYEVVHIEFKSVKKVGFLSTYDEFGTEQIKAVPETFPIPKDAQSIKYTNRFGDKSVKFEWYQEDGEFYTLEWLYIPRVYEAYRIDGDIWPIAREKPDQFFSVIDPYNSCKLGYHGILFSAMNAKNVAPFSRMLPYQFLFFIVMHQLVKLVVRNYGNIPFINLTHLPEFKNKLASDDMQQFLFYLQEGLGFTDSTIASETQSGNVSKPVQEVNLSNATDITNMINIAEWLNGQIGEAIGISPEREARFSPYSNVADNRQALAQSASITEEIFFKHSMLWREVMDSYVKSFQHAVRLKEKANPALEEHTFNYVLPNGSMELFRFERGYLNDSEFGIFLEDAGVVERYRDSMEQLLLPLIQNKMEGAQLVSGILKSRHEGASPDDIHDMIMKHLKKTDELRQQEIAAAQKNADIQRQQALDIVERQNKQKLDEIMLKGQQDKELVLLEGLINQGGSPDSDGIPTQLESEHLRAKIEELRAKTRNLQTQKSPPSKT